MGNLLRLPNLSRNCEEDALRISERGWGARAGFPWHLTTGRSQELHSPITVSREWVLSIIARGDPLALPDGTSINENCEGRPPRNSDFLWNARAFEIMMYFIRPPERAIGSKGGRGASVLCKHEATLLGRPPKTSPNPHGSHLWALQPPKTLRN